ncbi:dipeptide transport system permease protein [Aquamicrobium terrae]
MGGRLGRRLLAALPALIGVIVFTFILMRVLPGDPAVFFVTSQSAGPAEIAELRRSLGLDEPMVVQLGYYLRDISQGDLGHSLTTGQPVLADLMERLPASLELTVAALALALGLAIPLGMAAALWPGSVIDHFVRLLCTTGACVPTFVSGLLLIYLFYVVLGIAPDPTGRVDIFAAPPPDITGFLLIDYTLVGEMEGLRSVAAQLALPAFTMALFVLAPLARTTRASMLAVLNCDFVRTARSLGMSNWKVIVVYSLRNALLPVITITGLVFSTMLGANVLVEKVFSWPGVGSYALDALAGSDYAPVQGFVLLMAATFVVVNLMVDLVAGLTDPRMSVE